MIAVRTCHCGKPHRARGLCREHYQAWYRESRPAYAERNRRQSRERALRKRIDLRPTVRAQELRKYRERRYKRLRTSHVTNQEIAEAFALSYDTIKWLRRKKGFPKAILVGKWALCPVAAIAAWLRTNPRYITSKAREVFQV